MATALRVCANLLRRLHRCRAAVPPRRPVPPRLCLASVARAAARCFDIIGFVALIDSRMINGCFISTAGRLGPFGLLSCGKDADGAGEG